MAFANPPFAAVIGDLNALPSAEVLNAISKVAPFILPAECALVWPSQIPASSEYYARPGEDDELDVILSALDGGAAKVISVREDLKAQVPAARLAEDHLARLYVTAETTPEEVAKLFVATLKTDRPDGLYSTSVVSVSPKSSLLGQVYSSKESLSRSLSTGEATYYSRSRQDLWVKGATSGATQEVVRIRTDCDGDAVEIVVRQKAGTGFCHTEEISCFGPLGGMAGLEATLQSRMRSAPAGSYTKRLFTDEKLLKAKILEEASELCEADSKAEVAGEMADVIYFTLARCVSKGVSLEDVERVLDRRALKLARRRGDSKPKWEAHANGLASACTIASVTASAASPPLQQGALATGTTVDPDAPIKCTTYELASVPLAERPALFKRPLVDSTAMVARVAPIIDSVRSGGDAGLLTAISKFDRCSVLTSPVVRAPFPPEVMRIPDDVKAAIDQAYANIHLFHLRQLDKERDPMVVETMPGVICSRFARPIDRVGLYVPGGTAVLPSTALMLGIPAQVAGCRHISIASPPRTDGSLSPEILYIASKCGVHEIIKAGGAQAVAALAYGTESVTKVDKIFGPGNQYVTAAKVAVAGDTGAGVAIDMPAGPSEVLVVADSTAVPSHVAADLLSQAEHGPDSQVVLLAVSLSDAQLSAIEAEIDAQARRLPRLEIARQAISKSVIVKVKTTAEAIEWSNEYAPEHLILHVNEARGLLPSVRNAGSVFVGPYSPESCGDYASGTNHSLPTMQFARQYSGVSTLAFMKHITSQELTREGLLKLGPTVIKLAEVEGLEAHANAVRVRLHDYTRA